MARRGRRVGGYGAGAVVCALTLASGTTVWGQSHVKDETRAIQTVEIAPTPWTDPDPAGSVLASPQSGPIVTGSSQASQPHSLSRVSVPITSINQLYQMEPSSLDYIYQSGTATSIPAGKVKGRVLMFPGTKLARPASKVARLLWQGKIFKNDEAMAVNRFFGMRVIKGRVYQGRSWLDGGPSLILDYKETSRLYASYRDEIREVGPGIYLGLMYSRTQPDPTFKMYFALEAQR